MQSQLQGVEVEAICGGDDDLTIHDTILRESFEQYLVEIREITIERTRIAALETDLALAAEDDCPKAVPLRFIQVVTGRQLIGKRGEHRFDRRVQCRRGGAPPWGPGPAGGGGLP